MAIVRVVLMVETDDGSKSTTITEGPAARTKAHAIARAATASFHEDDSEDESDPAHEYERDVRDVHAACIVRHARRFKCDDVAVSLPGDEGRRLVRVFFLADEEGESNARLFEEVLRRLGYMPHSGTTDWRGRLLVTVCA